MYLLTNTLPNVPPQNLRRKIGNQIPQVMVAQFLGTSTQGMKSLVLDKDRQLKPVYNVDRSQGADNVMTYQVANFDDGDVIIRNKWQYDNEGNYGGFLYIVESDGRGGCAMSQVPTSKLPLADIDPVAAKWFSYTAIQSVEDTLHPVETAYTTVQELKVGAENVQALNKALSNVYLYLDDSIMTVDEFTLRAMYTRNESLSGQWFNAMSIFTNLSYDFNPVYGSREQYEVVYVLIDSDEQTTFVREVDEVKPLLHTAKRLIRLTYFKDMSKFDGKTDVALGCRLYKA